MRGAYDQINVEGLSLQNERYVRPAFRRSFDISSRLDRLSGNIVPIVRGHQQRASVMCKITVICVAAL